VYKYTHTHNTHTGGHDPGKERNPAWEPYTPAARLRGLNLLGTKFTWALERKQLCVTLNDGSSVRPVRYELCVYVCCVCVLLRVWVRGWMYVCVFVVYMGGWVGACM
jgi:hypothetical protein